MKKILLLILILCPFFAMAQPSNDQQLAVQYFQAGEYDKAVLYYEKLYNKNQADFYYNYYVKCLIELKQYKDAEKIIRKQQRKNPGNLKYYVDLGELYKVQDDPAKAKKEFDNAIKDLTAETQQVQNLANAFRDKGELDYALAAYEKGDRLTGGVLKYRMQKAELYNMKGLTEQMVEEYLSLIDDNPNNITNVENQLSFAVNFEDPENPRIEVLRVALLKRIQKHPDNSSYTELLIWFFQQKGDLASAFNQIKAIDKRQKKDGYELLDFGRLCKSNEDYDLAAKCFDYIITEKGKSSPYYLEAKIEMVDVLSRKVLDRRIYDQNDLLTLEKLYNETLLELGKSSSTVGLIRGLAKVKAYHLHDSQAAITLLYEALNLPGISLMTEAEIKLEMADVLLMQGNIWDASLYYSQVEKAFKHEPIGHEAKLRNAKISFYTGDFSWAQAQLDVLKASTSKLISNDAMQLSLLITDNLGMDSLPDAMKLYAEADLLVYQNRFDEALKKLDTLNGKFPWHGLADESRFLRYRMFMQQRDYEHAAEELQFIIDNFSQDILGDDALFRMAELEQYYFNQPEKAAELYKKLMFDHPGSLYVVEARKRFRTLRGEKIN
ncbi:MAG: tetratricopeptide repeat protein [Flavobacteriales bacterium]|nr:tetratricopeptide repeat protein [Flavobacteriales bacterium]